MKFIIALAFLISLGCQQKPTVGVTEGGILLEDRDYRQAIQADAVLFDTRSPFEFNTNRVPGSINLIPSDFVVKLDPLDAARRLSLYGVAPETPVVILGDGSGDDARLAWEFVQLGLKNIETLKISVFRTLNARIEPPKRNVPIWKPESQHGEMTKKEFLAHLKAGLQTSSQAREAAIQSSAAAKALQDRILVIQIQGKEESLEKFTNVFERVFETNVPLFDDRGLLKANDEWVQYLKRFNQVYLIDSSGQRFGRAFALTQWGAQSLYLVGP